ncbi:hypothetical protein L083_6519 [Actinoplanes sp. N902-109]|nr:hypothetical protein L083_6519 [Actinoplanes sp. N902-109]
MALDLLFFAWLYGAPFLLIVGLIRRVEAPTFATRDAAEHFGATTDRILTAALVLTIATPIGGVVLAVLLKDVFWARHFTGALAGMLLYLILFAAARRHATAPLIGTVPADQQPVPRVTRCIPISGGRGCPGG